MTDVRRAAEEIIDRLFGRLPALAAMRGYERDEARDAATREIAFVLGGIIPEKIIPDDDEC